MGNVLAIIGEYNPFHNGHLYHIDKSKELTDSDATILILSGNFVQRGTPSLIDKWKRTSMALKNGVDLVIELPVLFSISSAEDFAFGAISILNSLKIVDYLSFGSESGNLELLSVFANVLANEPTEFKALLQHELSKGLSFPKARENALMLYLGDIRKYSNILNCPNNILGIEYLKALIRSKSPISPITITRQGSEHFSKKTIDGFTSSSNIREMIFDNNYDDLYSVVPQNTYEIIMDAIRSGEFIPDLKIFEREIIFILRYMTVEEIANVPLVSEGLEHLIKEAASTSNTLEDLISKIKSKRFTQSRIQRILLYSLLGYSKADLDYLKKNMSYIRVLGATNRGKVLLSKISSNNKKLDIVTSIKQFEEANKKNRLYPILRKDILSTDVYTLGYLKNSKAGLDYTTKLITK